MGHYALLTACFILQLATVHSMNSSENLNTSNIIIGFFNTISILDTYEQFRYSTDELVPLLSLLATRFTKVLLAEDEYVGSTGQYNWPGIATANYNCLNSTKRKIELFMISSIINHCNCTRIQDISVQLANKADKANKICKDTIRTIFLQPGRRDKCPSFFSHCGHLLHLSRRYEWGEVIEITDYCKPKTMWNSTLLPSQMALMFFDYYQLFNINISNCRPYGDLLIKRPKIIKFIVSGILDTLDDKSPVTNTRLVSFWKMVTSNQDYNYIIFAAFDFYSMGDGLRVSSHGWWYLDKDPGTTNTSQFLFQEKIKVATKLDSENNPELLPWYRKTAFNKNSTGIIFQGNFSHYPVEKDFCRVMCIEKLSDLDNVKTKAVQMMALCGESFQMVLLIDKLSKNDLGNLVELNREQITIVIPVSANVLPKGFNVSYPKIIEEFGFKRGYYIKMNDCGFYNGLSTTSKIILNKIFADPKSSIYIFHYEEGDDRVKLGASHMFRLRSVLFKLCRKLVSSNRNTSTEIGFALKGFYRNNDFYASIYAMKNYNKYIDLVSSWADNQTSTMIFFSENETDNFPFDYGYQESSTEKATVGWYSYIDFLEETGYKSKYNQLVKASKVPNEEQISASDISLNNNELVIASCSILGILSLSVLIAIFLVRRYKKKYQLSYEERVVFFKGRSVENDSITQDPNDIPYDMEKYEISQDSFTIDMSKLLGSGEFGMVCRGSVNICDEEIQVAVKTTNPRKFNEISSKSLLSEIKILSHVGQHPNIIKLFGANTSNIRTGKVYVFLELCHLGSLLNFLRKLGTSSRMSITNANSVQSEKHTKYVNVNSSQDCVLDESLSNDLFRWSKEICSGMAYLAEKHVVHADLATRNVLLNLRHEAKICDFGLSRRMFNYESYVKSQQEPLPWKWLAPESLRYMQFDEKTDVWSYGVTLWELYSLGSVPYAGLSWDANFVQMLEGGLVLSKPDFEEKNMYKVMRECWKVVPEQRPSFTRILSILDVPNGESGDNEGI